MVTNENCHAKGAVYIETQKLSKHTGLPTVQMHVKIKNKNKQTIKVIRFFFLLARVLKLYFTFF